MSFNQRSNLVKQYGLVSKSLREKRNGHLGAVIWFTGLSGSGKSTLAYAIEQVLFNAGCQCYVLDGDNVRHGLCSDLGFTNEDRHENLRRIGEVAKLLVDSGQIVIAAFISPYQADRTLIRELISPSHFIEVYCNSSLLKCEERDVKGLYKKARSGLIANFTGVSSPYEIPLAPDLLLDTERDSVESCINQMIAVINQRKILTGLSI